MKIIGVSSAFSELSQDLQAMSMPSEGACASSNNAGKKKGKKKGASTKKKKEEANNLGLVPFVCYVGLRHGSIGR
jgi:hypothetical protein